MELISREELIKAIDDFIFNDFIEGGGEETLKDLIANFPTVESRPKGEWRDKGFEEYYCSNCGTKAGYCIGQPFGTYEIFQILSDFCPNCGADMRGKK